MKRTIEEVIDLIKQKRQSAINAIERLPRRRTIRTESLASTIDTYTDVLALLETSHLTEEQKAQDRQETDYTGLDALEELKAFKLVQYDEKGYMLDYTTLEKVMPTEISFIERDLKAYEELKEQINQRGNE